MDKKTLRDKYLQRRAEITPQEIESRSLEIANRCLELPIWNFSYYHIFLSIVEKGEINTDFLLHILQGKDKHIVVPKTDTKSNTLSHFLLTDSTVIQKNNWGIPEPKEGIPIPENKIEVVFVPLLTFDKKGHRVGYGKGFYDRFLSKCRHETIKIGLSLFEAEHSLIESHPYDVSLNYCITPKKIYRF